MVPGQISMVALISSSNGKASSRAEKVPIQPPCGMVGSGLGVCCVGGSVGSGVSGAPL
jgi:hypothetical protein